MFSAIFSENFLCLPYTYDSEKDMAKAKAKKKAGAKKKKAAKKPAKKAAPAAEAAPAPAEGGPSA
jgi:peptidoglycan hydrolase CwlO-like protein